MTIDDTGGHIPSGKRPPLEGAVDFTIMYVVYDAFRRDLRRLTAAAEAGRAADPAVEEQNCFAWQDHRPVGGCPSMLWRAAVICSVRSQSSHGGGEVRIRTAGKYRNWCGRERICADASGR